MASPPLTGWLEKEGKNGSWKRRFFVLEADVLRYYGSADCRGKCRTAQLSAQSVELANTKYFCEWWLAV